MQDFVVWPCWRHLKQALFSRTKFIFSAADVLSKALHLQMGCPWWLGASSNVASLPWFPCWPRGCVPFRWILISDHWICTLSSLWMPAEGPVQLETYLWWFQTVVCWSRFLSILSQWLQDNSGVTDFLFEAHTLQVSVYSYDDVYHLKCSLWVLVDTLSQLLFFRHYSIYQFALVSVLLVKPFPNSLRIFSKALNFFFDFIRQVGSQDKCFFSWFIEWFNVLQEFFFKPRVFSQISSEKIKFQCF